MVINRLYNGIPIFKEIRTSVQTKLLCWQVGEQNRNAMLADRKVVIHCFSSQLAHNFDWNILKLYIVIIYLVNNMILIIRR